MMQTEIKTRISITDINADGDCSVLTQQYIAVADQEHIISNHREALIPGQFDRAQEILPPNLFAAIQAIWTLEVIAAYEAKIAAIEAAMAPPAPEPEEPEEPAIEE